jgi:hypothetical protein
MPKSSVKKQTRVIWVPRSAAAKRRGDEEYIENSAKVGIVA